MGGLRRLTRELTGRIPRDGEATIYDLAFRSLARSRTIIPLVWIAFVSLG